MGSQQLGSSWAVSGCGEARCDLRRGTVYLSYSYCGATHAEDGCFLKRDVLMPYPYCCPRSFCPTTTFNDIISNSLEAVFGDNGEEELQMAANTVDQGLQSPNIDVVQYTADIDNGVQYDDYDWDKISLVFLQNKVAILHCFSMLCQKFIQPRNPYF